MRYYAVGVDLGGTNLRIAAVDDAGTLLEKVTLGTQVAKGRDFVIGEMTTAIRDLLGRIKQQGELAGIGVGIPGLIDIDTGVMRGSPNLPGWEDFPVHAEIERRLGAPVILENDANVAALGETWLGAARDYDSMLMYTLGTGVGGGIVLNSHIWHGMTGMAGELGHTTVEPNGHPCGCGNIGCLEQYASATAIVRMAREAMDSGRAPELRRAAETENREFSSKLVYQMAVQGDPAAQAIFDRVGKTLGIVIAAHINAFNLPMYVVGGGVASAWEAFSPAMMAEIRRRSFVFRKTAPETNVGAAQPRRTIVTRAVLGSDAGLFGAARLPLMWAEQRRPR